MSTALSDSLDAHVVDQETWQKAKDIYLQDPAHGYNNLVREMAWSTAFTAKVVNVGVESFPSLKSFLLDKSGASRSVDAIRTRKSKVVADAPIDAPKRKRVRLEPVKVVVQAFEGSPDTPSNALANVDELTPTEALNAALASVQRDLAKALPRESQLVRSYREQAIGLSASASACVRAAQATIAIITQRILDDAAKGIIGGEAVAIARTSKLIKLVKMCGDQGERAFKLQRLITGLPMQISATEVTETKTDMGDLARITESLERLQAGRSGKSGIRPARAIIDVASTVSDASSDDEDDASDDVSDLTDDDE